MVKKNPGRRVLTGIFFCKKDAKQQAIVPCAWLFGRRKSSARSVTLFMPAGIVVVAWRFRGYKKGEGCQVFCLGVLFGRFVWLHQADFPLKKRVFSGDEKKLHDLLQSAEFDTSLFAGY